MSDTHAAHGKMAPLEQPHPNERKHLWDYRNPRLTPPPAAVDPHFPRTLFKANLGHAGPDHPFNDVLTVKDAAELELETGRGWQLDPYVPKPKR